MTEHFLFKRIFLEIISSVSINFGGTAAYSERGQGWPHTTLSIYVGFTGPEFCKIVSTNCQTFAINAYTCFLTIGLITTGLINHLRLKGKNYRPQLPKRYSVILSRIDGANQSKFCQHHSLFIT